jgi:hypothetical protein
MLKNVTSINPETMNLLNKQVLITTNRNSKYIGKLVRLGKEKFVLMKVTGLSKAGTYKFMESNNRSGKREFNYSSTIGMVDATNYKEPEYEILGRPVDRADACKILRVRDPELIVFRHLLECDSPEQFFEDNKNLEPQIWFDTLRFVFIPVKRS